MSVTKLRGTLQDYFEHMVGRTIEGVGIFNDELVIVLDNGDEVCLWQDDEGLMIQINERPPLDA